MKSTKVNKWHLALVCLAISVAAVLFNVAVFKFFNKYYVNKDPECSFVVLYDKNKETTTITECSK